jgi:chemotaxis protein MotB
VRRRREKHEEAAHHERWLVSYADFMTLLFALFVVLFASSHHDKKTIQKVSSAVKNGFQQLGAFSGNTYVLEGRIADQASGADLKSETVAPTQVNFGFDVQELQRKLNQTLGKEIARQEVELRMTPEGFVISLHELGFFDSGEAQLKAGASEKIKQIASVLMQYGLDMRVEGHSDNLPIHNDTFNSNWELSTARAMAVAMMLLKDSGFDPQRMSIAGYGQYHPLSSNDTVDGRRANRRVDIVVVYSTRANSIAAR